MYYNHHHSLPLSLSLPVSLFSLLSGRSLIVSTRTITAAPRLRIILTEDLPLNMQTAFKVPIYLQGEQVVILLRKSPTQNGS